jgi:glyoxylase-like metal-dependent hydrolase (beta-lactamase superfamily II)
MPDVPRDPVCVDAGNPGPMTGRGNNTWLIDGRMPTLVDAGVGRREHLDTIARHLAGRPLARVLVTHGHADHASGVPALRARWPGLDVWKHAPFDAESGWLTLEDGGRIDAGDGRLDVIHTPGHAPDHVCLHDPESGALFTGDMLTLGTTVMIPAGRGGHLRSYLASLDRLAALSPRRAYPGHGPVIDDPGALIAEYIAHRALRERQVAECLAEGLTVVADIVKRIYPDVPEGVRAAAALTVEAHLEKLREDAEASAG